MGTSIQNYELSAADFGGQEGFVDYLAISKPGVLDEIHRSFLEVGCDVVETNTFGSTRPKLDEWGVGDQVREVNLAAAQIARRAADAYSTPERPRFVAGSMGPTGFLPSTDDPVLGAVTFEQLADYFGEQAVALAEGGCDLLIIETAQDILELKAAIVGCRRALRRIGHWLPIQAQVTLDTSGRMLLGTDVGAALAILENVGVDVVGLNCSTGPEHMREPVRFLCANTRLPISVIPNAGLPRNEGGRAFYPMLPEPFAAELAEFVTELGVNVVGGCCGTTPEHIRLLVQAVGGRPAPVRTTDVGAGLVPAQPMIASAMRAYSIQQDPPPLIVGERVNSQGSRAVKRLLLADDYDRVVDVAREQVEGGAHTLDVCVALTERSDEAEQMRRLVRKLASVVETPLMIDTTEDDVVRVALENYPGRAIVNSVHLESGRDRADRILPLVKEHGAAILIMTIDEVGMAKTADRKVEVARRVYEIACGDHGLRPDQLIYDTLTFTLATGDPEFGPSALETIEGIRRIKAELPGVFTSLGVSNVSFGLSPAARGVLNSVFLHHCVQAGLDLALVNPSHITPYSEIDAEARRLADDLINNRPDALPRFIEYFTSGAGAGAAAGKQAAAVEDDSGPLEQRIHNKILFRRKEGIEALIDEAVKSRTAKQVLDDVLLPAMKEVGDRFGAGELILPFVLQSAEVMKRAVAHLEQYMEKSEGYTKGKVVIATVFGDVHDIGKSLVNTILSNNGYTVYDLGKQVPINTILEKAVEVEADAIGLSALLVSTSKQMPLCVQELARRGLKVPVLIGGAAINPAFGRRAAVLPDGELYGPGVFYCKDAFEGLGVMDRLVDEEQRSALVAAAHAAARAGDKRAAVGDDLVSTRTERSESVNPAPIPTPPFWGWRALKDIPLDDLFPLLDRRTLFNHHWGASKVKGEARERIYREELEPRLARMRKEAEAKGYLQPGIIYGYFPAAAAGNELIVFDPADHSREIARFPFPRQPRGEQLCLADYWTPLMQDGPRDVVGFQIVTAGAKASEYADALRERGEDAEAYFVHGLAAQTAEALAEYAQTRFRAELGLAPDQGRRFSWGYPACPDLEQQRTLFEILPARQELGMDLTDEGWQLVPEQSTAAIVAHHPQAKYYSGRGGPSRPDADGAVSEGEP
ncbi:MAG: methionine synthase [Chloroflexi bacterium]|nr:methionine synthase [Chloroflexota bacterium]